MEAVQHREGSSGTVMSLTGHLTELRSRLIKAIIALVLCTIISELRIDDIMHFLTAPAGTLYFIKPAEAFLIYFKTGLTAGAILSSPVLFYQFWAFVVPAFTTEEKRTLMAVVPLSLLLFLSGIAFAFFLVLPQGLRFFLAFTSETVQPMISMESYLDFVLMLVLPFGVIFNIPMVLCVFAKMGLISSQMLRKKRKFVIMASFILAAVITPTTDMVSQCLLAVPMIALYEGSNLFIRFVLRK
ncbi:MAG: twin-arginine translocase subunit TatC [Acidaminococcus sp.]|jgi:sec-independent protein translocase protein TatC|nr:twin-arginine translocase subunit TatC [Acidaminococcus sp.]MCI2114215.1 twin-arginine translocase subunit TatC [Acidaminococcus sp.]MCI2116150.1 twin-arginine translocase subunit TatC [Acidaminococcus sp.]